MEFYRFLADVVVVLHAAYVAFIVFGLVAVLVGFFLGWQWVRNFWFRAIHLGLIGFAIVQTAIDLSCPLTTLEQDLRDKAGQATYTGDFIGHWVHELMFYEVPPYAFLVVYCLFGAAVLAAFIWIPPQWPSRFRRARQEQGPPARQEQQPDGSDRAG